LKGSSVHVWLMVMWGVLLLPTLLWWRDAVFWVALMSWYNIFVGHWSSYESARAEEMIEQTKESVEESNKGESDERTG
jgi:hypothetical protein